MQLSTIIFINNHQLIIWLFSCLTKPEETFSRCSTCGSLSLVSEGLSSRASFSHLVKIIKVRSDASFVNRQLLWLMEPLKQTLQSSVLSAAAQTEPEFSPGWFDDTSLCWDVHVERSFQRRAGHCLYVAVKCNKNSSSISVSEALSRTINSERLAGQRWPHGKSGSSLRCPTSHRGPENQHHCSPQLQDLLEEYSVSAGSMLSDIQRWQTR